MWLAYSFVSEYVATRVLIWSRKFNILYIRRKIKAILEETTLEGLLWLDFFLSF